MNRSVAVIHKGLCDYIPTTQKMTAQVVSKDSLFRDEIWVLEHNPVFTQGTSCKETPIPQGQHIPVVHSDRGGQITYHGPGQLIVYCLFDIKALGIGPKALVAKIEQTLISLLEKYQIIAARKSGAPGVYVGDKKIAALGFRIKKGRCYHGLSLNVDMDLEPFTWINPCGYKGQAVTQMSHFLEDVDMDDVKARLVEALCLEFDLQVHDDNVVW